MRKILFFFLVLAACSPVRTHKLYEDGSAAVIQGNYRLAGACILPDWGCTPDEEEDQYTRVGQVIAFQLTDGSEYTFTLSQE